MSAFDDLDKLAARIDPILRKWYQANRFGAQAEIELHDIAEVIKQIASSPGINLLKSLAQDAARQAIKDDTFSPDAAAVPARDLLLALSDIERAADQLAKFCKDERFKPARIRRGKQRVSARVLPAEFVEQMAYLTGLLLMAATQCRYAVDKLLRLDDPRRHVAMLGTPSDPNDPARVPAPLTLPRPNALALPAPSTPSVPALTAPRKGSKEADKMILELRTRTSALAERLRQAAVTGRERLQSASLGGRAYSPNVVGAAAFALSSVIADALNLCAEISRDAVVPVTATLPAPSDPGGKARTGTRLGLWLWFVVGGLAAAIGLALILWGLFGSNQSSSNAGLMLVLIGLTIEVAVTVTLAIRITIARESAANRKRGPAGAPVTESTDAPEMPSPDAPVGTVN